MPTQVFACLLHGEFDVRLSFADDVPSVAPCPTCGECGQHVLKPPIIVGGTSGVAARGGSAWNERANELRCDPYTQAKAQLESVYNRKRDLGQHPGPITERAIQAAAQQIVTPARGGVAQRQVAQAKRQAAKVRAGRHTDN